MATSFTPGLRVAETTLITKDRILPLKGEVRVKVGEHMEADQVVASTNLPGNVTPINAANVLGIAPADVRSALKIREGDKVEKDQLIAEAKSFFGMFKNKLNAPITGSLESVSDVTGQLIFRDPPVPVEIDAYIEGRVTEIFPQEGVEVQAVGSFIQGIFGIGGETSGDRRAWSLAAMTGWAVVQVAAHLLQMPGDSPRRTVLIAAVQTNVAQSNKIGWTIEQELEEFRRLSDFTELAARGEPDLIVWPETMMPGITIEPTAVERLRESQIYFTVESPQGPRNVEADFFANQLAELSRRSKAPLLVGEDARVGFEVQVHADGVEFESASRYNSVYLIHRGVLSSDRYDKAKLTPFGETMPYIAAVPGLQQKLLDFGARGMKFDLEAGTRRTVFRIPARDGEFRVATPICFEVTVGPYVRSLAFEGGVRRADVLVNVTNDGWFGSFAPARDQHLQIARWRALELATPIVRAANTGISCGIDAMGRLREVGPDSATSPALSEGIVRASVELSSQVTIYARVGDVPGWLCTGLLVPALVVPRLRKHLRP